MTLLGGFAPMGAQAADLTLVDQGLSRTAVQEMVYLDEQTTLTYQTGVIAGGGLGLTMFEVFIGGAWQDLDDICNPASPNYALGLNLTRDTPMRVTITIDPALHGVAPAFHQVAASLIHEITVHAMHAAPWLRNLRSGAYLPAGIRSRWRTSNLVNVNMEHDTFAQGHNRAYNQTAQNVFAATPAPLPFQADIRADMTFHLPPLTGPLNPPGGPAPNWAI